jgi:hypothetical protein
MRFSVVWGMRVRGWRWRIAPTAVWMAVATTLLALFIVDVACLCSESSELALSLLHHLHPTSHRALAPPLRRLSYTSSQYEHFDILQDEFPRPSIGPLPHVPPNDLDSLSPTPGPLIAANHLRIARVAHDWVFAIRNMFAFPE